MRILMKTDLSNYISSFEPLLLTLFLSFFILSLFSPFLTRPLAFKIGLTFSEAMLSVFPHQIYLAEYLLSFPVHPVMRVFPLLRLRPWEADEWCLWRWNPSVYFRKGFGKQACKEVGDWNRGHSIMHVARYSSAGIFTYCYRSCVLECGRGLVYWRLRELWFNSLFCLFFVFLCSGMLVWRVFF